MEFLILTIASLSLGILVIYWSVPLINIVRHKNASEKNCPVSVVICAHNELDNLKTLIPLLLKQEHPDFEIIIVDDRSDDGTYDFMLTEQNEKLKLVRVDQVHDHINAKKYALTLGIKAAKNDVLLLTDADCVPSSGRWITTMTRGFDEQTVFSLGVSIYQAGTSFLDKFIQFETRATAMNYIGFALAGNPYMGVGRNLAYRKSSFLENKGFSKIQHITGGDDDLIVNERANKNNTRVVIGAEALTYSIPEPTWQAYVRQKIRHWSVGKYYRTKDKFLLGLQNLSNLVFWVALTILAVQTNNYIIPAGMFLFRMIFVVLLNHMTSKRFGYRMNIWLVPVMDILYVIFASIFGIVALLTKKVKWKK